jgi:hypothetical protein
MFYGRADCICDPPVEARDSRPANAGFSLSKLCPNYDLSFVVLTPFCRIVCRRLAMVPEQANTLLYLRVAGLKFEHEVFVLTQTALAMVS